MQKFRPWLPVLFIILLCFISRLPQLLSPHFIMDGDECILGLMAKHMLQGKDFPVFFYGQSYGFSLLETLFIALGYCIGGVNDYSLKLSMLALWTVGIIFFYRSLRLICRPGSNLPILITVLFVLCPAWAVWSMKARGGYLTSFTLTWLITYLLFNKTLQKPFVYAIIGVLLIVIYESQPLWLPGLLPFVVYGFFRGASVLRSLLGLLLGLVIGAVPFMLLLHHTAHYWEPQALNFSAAAFETAHMIPQTIYTGLHGYYYLNDVYKPSVPARFFADVFMIFIKLTLLAAVVFAIPGLKKRNALPLIAFLSLICSLLYLPFVPPGPPRYVLPLTGMVLFATCIYLDMLTSKWLAGLMIGPLCLLGSIAMFMFKDYKFEGTSRKQLLSFISYMEQRKIFYVFSTRALMQWQIIYYSNERVISRFTSKTDRYPEYVERVNRALDEAKPTCIIGFDGPYAPDDIPFIRVHGYLFYPYPTREFLQNHDFAF